MQAASVAVLLLLGETGGHMIMNTPKPYNLDIQPFLQVDPMSGDHYPFPCHNQYSFATRTPVEAGHATLVNFTGGAQHGGGSCQFSITYDEPVGGGGWNKSAKFKTIYSIIGGCPAVFTDETHNLAPAAKDPSMREDGKHCGNDSGIDCIRSFMISIPKFLRNGPATFAWTWFNKLGNKEMYMNCAPINITGGTGDEKQIEDLPDIFVANYPNDPELPTCITGTHNDKVVVNFPNPGKYGLILQGPVEPVNKPSGYCTQIPKPSALPAFE
ncbi:lytic polysaccharide monooxygenase, partial [Parathielavia hyrcaniae]